MDLITLKKQYKRALILLRPRGVIWQVKIGSLTDKELDIWAEELARVHLSTDKLFTEANLATTFELLEEWEDIFKLPHVGSYNERIAALLAASAPQTSHSILYYMSIAEMLSVKINIVEHVPFMCGLSECGGDDELGAEEIVYYWDVEIISAQSEQQLNKMKDMFIKHHQFHTVLTFFDKR